MKNRLKVGRVAMAMMIIVYTFLFCVSVLSCKSVKKDKQEEKKELKEESKEVVDVVEKKEKEKDSTYIVEDNTDETIYKPVDKDKPMVLPDGKEYHNTEVIKKKKTSKKTSKEVVKEKETKDTKKQAEVKKEVVDNKTSSKVEREPKNFFWTWFWIILIIIALYLGIRKYRKWLR